MIATSGRARIAYEATEGVGADATDVLLIHAGVTDRRSWSHVVDRLRGRHRCVSYDARGFGETEYEQQDGWTLASDALAVLDAAGIDRAIVVACSMGGMTALDLVVDHPERVAALVLIGTAVSGAPYPEITEEPTASLVAACEAAEEAADWGEVNRLEAHLWLDGPTAPEGRVGGATRELFLAMNGRALHAPDPGERVRGDAWSRADEIAVPTLVLIGRLDLPDIIAVDAQLAELIPGASVRYLDGVAHLPHFEGDPVCLEAIEQFTSDVDAAGRV